MSPDRPTATCSNLRCQFVIDLTDDRVTIAPTADGAVAVCPHCGGTAILSKAAFARAGAGRRDIRV